MLQSIRLYWKWIVGALLVVLTGGVVLKFFNPFSTGKHELDAARFEGKAIAFGEQAAALEVVAQATHASAATAVQEAVTHAGAQERAEAASAATGTATKEALAGAGDDVDRLAKLLD